MESRFPKLLLLSGWLFALLGLMFIAVKYMGPATHFFGIADDREQTIRFATAVEVVRYGFVSGQEVQAGDLILEVRQPQVLAELQYASEQIQALRFNKSDAEASMQTDLIQAKSGLERSLAELDKEIRHLQAQQKSIQSLVSPSNPSASVQVVAGIRQELESVRIRKQATRRSAEAHINELMLKLATAERPVDARIAEYEERLRELQRQQTASRITAQIDGRVGDVLFKPGETVPPYQPIVTVHGTQPSFVKGYIHESVVNNVALDQTVWVRSLSSVQSQWHQGSVQSLGSRIVEFPPRLRVNMMHNVWGREVVVSLSLGHSLMLGEKVDIQLQAPNSVQTGIDVLLVKVQQRLQS